MIVFIRKLFDYYFNKNIIKVKLPIGALLNCKYDFLDY